MLDLGGALVLLLELLLEGLLADLLRASSVCILVLHVHLKLVHHLVALLQVSLLAFLIGEVGRLSCVIRTRLLAILIQLVTGCRAVGVPVLSLTRLGLELLHASLL